MDVVISSKKRRRILLNAWALVILPVALSWGRSAALGGVVGRSPQENLSQEARNVKVNPTESEVGRNRAEISENTREEKYKKEADVPESHGSKYVEITDRYLSGIESIRQCAESFLPVAKQIESVAISEAVAALERSLEGLQEEGATPSPSAIDNFYWAVKGVAKVQAGRRELLARSMLLSLFSIYDAYVGDLLRDVYDLRPELLDGVEKEFTFKEILRLGSIESIRKQIVDKEVEQLLRESYVKQFEVLERKFEISTLRKFEGWRDFVECAQRRNLMAHCDGVVSEQYLSVCKKEGVPKLPELGVKLKVGSDYLLKAIDLLYEVGLKLGQVLYRVVLPGMLEELDKYLNDHVYGLLRDERYALARMVGGFATTVSQRKSSKEYLRRMLLVNYAQALRWSGSAQEAKRIISLEDWSACAEEFALAVAVLTEQENRVFEIMRSIGSSGKIRKENYQEWHVFRDIRKKDMFSVVYRELFGEDFRETMTRRVKMELRVIKEHVE